LASTQPAEPAPTMMKSNESVWVMAAITDIQSSHREKYSAKSRAA
jgi:hypothetical protein